MAFNNVKHGLLFLWVVTIQLSTYGVKTADSAWGYYEVIGAEGPSNWKSSFPTCGGHNQSPVHIRKSHVMYDDNLLKTPFRFSGYSTKTATFTMKNNGHTVNTAVPSSVNAQLSGGGLPGTFKPLGFHFHWGAANSNGSEHWLDDRQYPIELHMVHLNTKYDTVAEALDKEDGLAVLGMFLEIGTTPNTVLDPVISKFQNVLNEDDSVDVTDVDLEGILPTASDSFYRYHGSLTTPPCSEVVTWTMFSKSLKVSGSQYQEFMKLYRVKTGTDPLLKNFRPVQPLHGREVSASKHQLHEPYAGHWNYALDGDEGPYKWSKLWPYCGGQHQSPIDLDDRYTVLDESLQTTFNLNGYDATFSVKMENNGHTMKLSLPTNRMLTLSGGGLRSEYVALQLHFHWGSTETRGSEHTQNQQQFPLEMHIVHIKKMYFPNRVSDAYYDESGLAVLGVFFEVGDEENQHFSSIFNAFEAVKYKGNPKAEVTANWYKLLPTNRKDFYRYQGSLTTPPCYQAVEWTVFNEKVKISQGQMDKLQKGLYNIDSAKYKKEEEENAGKIPGGVMREITLVDNYRPTQNLNKRKVFVSSPDMLPRTGTSSSDAAIMNPAGAILSVLFLYITIMLL